MNIAAMNKISGKLKNNYLKIPPLLIQLIVEEKDKINV